MDFMGALQTIFQTSYPLQFTVTVIANLLGIY